MRHCRFELPELGAGAGSALAVGAVTSAVSTKAAADTDTATLFLMPTPNSLSRNVNHGIDVRTVPLAPTSVVVGRRQPSQLARDFDGDLDGASHQW